VVRVMLKLLGAVGLSSRNQRHPAGNQPGAGLSALTIPVSSSQDIRTGYGDADRPVRKDPPMSAPPATRDGVRAAARLRRNEAVPRYAATSG